MIHITRRLILSGLFPLPVLCRGQQPIFFVQMSDPRFGMYTNNHDFAQETANFEFAIANVNRIHPAFVVVTGDLVNKSADAGQLAEYKRITRQLDSALPLYSPPGNHDLGNSPTVASLKAYRQNIGPDYYTLNQPGDRGYLHVHGGALVSWQVHNVPIGGTQGSGIKGRFPFQATRTGSVATTASRSHPGTRVWPRLRRSSRVC